jgi:PAS domain S-box-containing protein
MSLFTGVINGVRDFFRRETTQEHAAPESAGGASVRQKLAEILDNYKQVSAQLRDERRQLETALQKVSGDLREKVSELHALKTLMQNVLQNISSAIIAVDLEGRVTLLNRAAEEKLGYTLDEVRGRPYADFFTPLHGECKVTCTLRSGVPFCYEETVLRCRYAEERPFAVSTTLLYASDGSIAGAMGIFEDLTRFKQLEQRVRRSEEVSSLGALVAGLAHGIKNPLGIISGYIQLLPERYDDPVFRDHFVKTVSTEIDKLVAFTRRLLDFGQPVVTVGDRTDINSLLRSHILLVSEQARRQGIDIRADLEDSLPPLRCSSEQLGNVLLDFVVNAMQAMPTGGKLEVITRRENGNIHVLFRDTGSGIPPEHMEKIFNPFFTTKKGGSGMGLSIAHRVIHGYGGGISVESVPGKGTAFDIALPISVS